jgi:tetratricopeptide (TPR) repeat protein
MYERAVAIDPNYVTARNNLGSAYMQLALDERAIEELQRALQVDSSYSLAYYNLACVHARAGRGAAAAQYLAQAVALEPEARQWAQTDADFARVRSVPEVRKLLEQ